MSARQILITCTLTGAAFGAGFVIGRNHTEPKPTEAPRPAIVHKSGAITLERTNQAPPPPLDIAPGTEARTRSVTLELEPLPERREIQIDFQEGQDGTRVTVKGEGIAGGKDFVIPVTSRGTVQKWTAGIAFDGKSAGPWIGYQWKNLTVSTAITKNQAIVTAGIRF